MLSILLGVSISDQGFEQWILQDQNTLSQSPRLAQVSLGAQTGDDDGWSQVHLSGAEQWRTVFYTLFRGAGSALYQVRAKRLNAYGWSSQDLLDACVQPQWERWFVSLDVNGFADDMTEAWAALVQATVIFHDAAAASAAYRRLQLIHSLSQSGWTHSQSGDHLGLSKQRIQKLLKDFLNNPGLRAFDL